MIRWSLLAGALAAVAFTVPASAQSNAGGGAGAAHSPRLGKPAAQTTGASAKAINRASGGGVRHGPRSGSGKVKATTTSGGKPARPAAR